MKALILNSGLGSRMGVLTSEHPKCMTEISPRETILSRQLNQLSEAGIRDVVITTGYYDGILVDYCHSLDLPLNFTFVKNPVYDQTNYIYSIYCAREYLDRGQKIGLPELCAVMDKTIAEGGAKVGGTLFQIIAAPQEQTWYVKLKNQPDWSEIRLTNLLKGNGELA